MVDIPTSSSTTNRPPAESRLRRRSLADVLQDPDTKWADIRAAIKTQGRGSFVVKGNSNNNATMAATTNAGVLKALQDSVFLDEEHHQRRTSSGTTATSEELDQLDGIIDLHDEMKLVVEEQSSDTDNGFVRGADASNGCGDHALTKEVVTFADSTEQKNEKKPGESNLQTFLLQFVELPGK